MISKLKPGLYCVGTPIGNLEDISIRSIETLKNSDLILCEDTRISKKLFDRYQINKNLISNHKFNEKKNLDKVIEILKQRKIISIISDAGTPGISDPGRILINECIENDINVYPVPGPSAVTSALSVSGFSDKYFFCGFLPEKKGEILKLFDRLAKTNFSIVFFISPKKIKRVFKQLELYFLDRNIVICREISKIHEEYIRSSVKNLQNINFLPKGECTVVISEGKEEKKLTVIEESVKKKIDNLISKMSVKNIVTKFNLENGIPKKIIYNYCLSKKNEK
tara:strand:- start:2331 stop:3170 length:840 start_codon:yes stop_codon:yes gene_type:complete